MHVVFTSRLLLYTILVLAIPTIGSSQKLWLTAGQNLSNTRYNKMETTITPENVSTLKMKWAFETGGDVSATPAVDEGFVYFPDWKGNLYKVDATTGQLI